MVNTSTLLSDLGYIAYKLNLVKTLGVWVHFEPIGGFSGGPGDKDIKKFTMFGLKLVWYSLLKMIKLCI